MSIETKPVEITPDNAGAPVVVENKAGENATAPEVDLLDEFQKVLEDNDKLRKDRDNYKRIGLAKKRGEYVDEPVELDEDEVERRAEEKAQEIVARKKAEENESKQREIALKALKENRELKIALKNRSGVVTTPTGSGTGGDSGKPTNNFWTVEQLAYFKKRGLDPEKVKENYMKLKA